MKFIYFIISIFAAYGIYAAVMLNDNAQGAAVVEAVVCGVLIFIYLKGCVRRGKSKVCFLQRGQGCKCNALRGA